jgi:hypothetical protein
MNLRTGILPAAIVAALFGPFGPSRSASAADGIAVDKEKKTVTVDAKVSAPNLANCKHPDLKPDDPRRTTTYAIEVFACGEFPAQKAHETVINSDIKPSDLHKAIESLGVKAGKAGLRGGAKAAGPELKLFLEWNDGGKTKRVPAEQIIINTKTKKPVEGLKWLFTGSVMSNPDPEKDDVVYGADLTKSIVGIYPVTNEVVIQTNLEEEVLKAKLDPDRALLPKEGTKIKLIIEVPK